MSVIRKSVIGITLASAVACCAEPKRVGISDYEAVQSGSGKYIALSGIGLSDVSPSFRMRLRVLVVTLGLDEVQRIWTGLKAKWTVTWAPGDVLVIVGDDGLAESRQYRYKAYYFDGEGRVREREATSVEMELVRAAFEKKHGHAPNA
jgi:hypothetical protein